MYYKNKFNKQNQLLKMGKNKANCKKKISQIKREQDIYGHQINLTYKNSSTFKSIFGGVSIIIVRVVIFAFLAT